jgi:hypothetical protein
MQQDRFAVGLSLLCAAAVLALAMYARWDFPTALIATLAAMLGGMLASRLLGVIGTRAAQPEPPVNTNEPATTASKEAIEPDQRTT